MTKNLNEKRIVQNAENKKVVTLKDTKKQENSSIFGISVEQLVSNTILVKKTIFLHLTDLFTIVSA